MGDVDVLLAVPGVISFVLVLVVFWLHGRIVYRRGGGGFGWLQRLEEPGDYAWLQFWTCLAAFISVLSGCVESLGFYDDDAPGAWCQFEAICSSFGELAVILWVICCCIYLYAQLKEKLSSSDVRRRLFIYFHVCVWSLAFLMTAIPAGQGYLGLNTNSNHSEAWCWFKPGHRDWEWVQFYAPLLIYVVVSSIAFVACIRIIRSRLSAPSRPSATIQPSSTLSINSNGAVASRVIENEGVLYVRMAWQFGVLFLVFVPDLIVVLADEESGSFHSGSRGAEFLWRCEGLALATMYFFNGGVRTMASQLPEIQFIYRCFRRCDIRRSNPLHGISDADPPLPTIHTPSDLRPKIPLSTDNATTLSIMDNATNLSTDNATQSSVQSEPLPDIIANIERDCDGCDGHDYNNK
jgi:hypothetical protein